KAPVVPNAFSPNGDGTHDKWDITFLESYPGCVIDVYNRYGQLVYHTVNYPVPWDGKINGRDAPVGTYYYIINPKNGRKPLTSYATYAYHLGLSPKTNLSAGFSAGITNITFDASKADFGNGASDPAIGNANSEIGKIKPDIGFGLWLYSSNYFIGLSAQQIIP